MFKKVVVTGSLAFDHIMSMPGRFSDHILPDKLHILNVSFIMQTFRQEFSGTAGNICYTLGLLENPCILVGTAGKDFRDYRKHLSKNKFISLGGVKEIKSKYTAKGFAITDRDDNQIWGFYDGAMRDSDTINLKPYLSPKRLLMIAPDNPRAMMNYVSGALKSGTPYVFDPAFNIAHFSLQDLKKAVKNARILIGNDYEINLITRRLKISQDSLLIKDNILITTLGLKGSVIKNGNKVFKIPPAKPEKVADPTGAGDAYRAGFLAGFVRKLPLEVCGKMGATAAVYTVEKYGTQTHTFTPIGFEKRYKNNFGNCPFHLTSN